MAPRPPSLSVSGSLSQFDSYDETPHIGTTFPSTSTQLSAFLSAPNSDKLIADLARLVSHRGVVFFSAQDITLDQQKDLGRRIGDLSGNPFRKGSGLHKHPISEETSELGVETSQITSQGGIALAGVDGGRASEGWHADITFEPVPSDYAILKMHTLPRLGGDTLWASGYAAYDRLSPAMQRFLEGLTALHDAPFFRDMGHKILQDRGHALNTGDALAAVHPVVRTHPITGYRALFVNRSFTRRIMELTKDESDALLDYLFRHVAENHDFQVRYRWGVDDVAIWDNRATFHTATNDYGSELRTGNRIVSIGERPYFDPASKSRAQVLRAAAQI